MSARISRIYVYIIGAVLLVIVAAALLFFLFWGSTPVTSPSQSSPQSVPAQQVTPHPQSDAAASARDTPQSRSPQSAHGNENPSTPTHSAEGIRTEDSSPANALAEIIAITDSDLANPVELTDLSAVLAGNALDSHRALMEQWQAEGIRQEGQLHIVSSRVVSTEGNRTVIEACVDTSGITLLDDQSAPVNDPQAPTRSLTIFTLDGSDGLWKIVDETLPENPEC